MNEILFQAKSRDTGEWIEGSLVKMPGKVNNGRMYILPRGEGIAFDHCKKHIAYSIGSFTEVNPKTVGQYIGLDDKTGRKIFEGDLVKLDGWEPSVMQVAFIEGAFCLADGTGEYAGDIHYIYHAGVNQSEVVGNIYDDPDNPDLLWFSQREADKS